MEPTDVSQTSRFGGVFVVFGGIRPLAYVSPCQTQGTLLESEGVSKAKDKSVSSRFTRDVKPDDSAFEWALLTSILTRSLVEEFLAKYLKATVAPDLDLIVRIDRK